MTLRLGLRWKILLLAVLAPVALGLAALTVVNHRVSAHVRTTIDEDLTRSARVCEALIQARAKALESAARVVAQDPRFLSVMALAGSSSDRQVRATVAGVARDFNLIARADLFEAFDAHGRLVASIGHDASDAARRGSTLQASLATGSATGLLVQGDGLLQVAAVQVVAGGRRVGTLLVGLRVGTALAAELGRLTRSQVSFPIGDPLAARPAPAPRGVVEVASDGRRSLTLSDALPGADAATPARYLLRRSLDQEMAFLGVIQSELVGLALIILLAAVGVGLMVTMAITRPVGDLVRAAEAMERGDYDSPLTARGRDELGYLAQRFRDMRQHERDYVSSLEAVARLKSDFITVASHEMRTPVTLIKAYGELLGDGRLGPVTAEQRRALEVIQQSADVMVRITNDAESMAELQGERPHLQLVEVDLGAVVQDGVGAAKADAPGRRVPIAVRLDARLGRMPVDAARLAQAIAHLVRNAIRFTPDEGSVDVSARRDALALVVDVRDTGVGVPEERQAHLFRAAFLLSDAMNHHSSSRLEFNSAGLGLGLPIARGIVEAHGGTIAVWSRPGEGSTFTIRIPEPKDAGAARAA